MSRGRVVWEGGKLHVTPGTGRFVPLPPFGPLYDGLDRQYETEAVKQYGHVWGKQGAGGARGGSSKEEL